MQPTIKTSKQHYSVYLPWTPVPKVIEIHRLTHNVNNNYVRYFCWPAAHKLF